MHLARKVVLFAFVTLAVPSSVASAAVITFDTAVPVLFTGTINPFDERFVEDGFDVEAFWATDVGTPTGAHIGGHFHLTTVGVGDREEAQHFNLANELQGFFLEAVGDGAFSLSSLDFTVWDNLSINGFSSNQVNVLISTTFDPTGSAASQFTAFPVSGSGNLAITGFENVTRVFIASSASVRFDNITLNAPVVAPEPASLLLIGCGVAGLAVRARRRRNGQ